MRNLSKYTIEELKQKREFAEAAGGLYGISLARACTDELNKKSEV